MNEKQLDSSNVEYTEIKEPITNNIKSQWDMAIGLQEVANLKPSAYLSNLLIDNINGYALIEEVKESLHKYYTEKEKKW